MALQRFVDRAYHVLSRQYPPLDDRLRMVFMAALLLTTYDELLSTIPLHLRRCPPELFQAVGAMDLLPTWLKTPDLYAKLTWQGRMPLLTVWCLAIVGLGGRLPIILTAVGFTAFWSMSKCCSGTGHGLHLPMYTLIVLALYTRPGAFSLDAWIARRWPKYPFAPRAHVDATGLARYLILILAVYTLFAGGLSKSMVAGFGWLDGETLQVYLTHMNKPKGAVGQWMLDTVLDHRWLAAILATWTVLLELGSILAVFWRRARVPVLLSAGVFHIGIYLMMYPRYFPQMCVYLIPFHWGGVVGRVRPLFGRLLAPPEHPVPTLPPGPGHRMRNVAFAGAVITTLVFFIVRQREWYPFTHVPMYSDHLTASHYAGHAVADFDHVAGLQRVSAAYDQGRQGWFFTFWIPERVELRGVAHPTGGAESTTDLTPLFHARLNNWTLWNERIAHAVLTEFHRHPVVDGVLQRDATKDDHLSHCLQGALRVLARIDALDGYEQVQLIYHLGGEEEVVLCSLPSAAPTTLPTFRPTAPGYR